MTDIQGRIEKKLRIAGILLTTGLSLQVLTLVWNHPLAFLAFMFIASPLVLAGVIMYLYSIITD